MNVKPLKRKVIHSTCFMYLGQCYHHPTLSAYIGKEVDIQVKPEGLSASYNGIQIATGLQPVMVLDSFGTQGGAA